MKNVVIIGAGKIGRMAAHFLAQSGDYAVHVVDAHEGSWRGAVAGLPNATGATVDFANEAHLDAALKGKWALISCAPFFCNPLIAERAKAHGVHYLDLTEDVAVTKKVMSLAEGAATAVIPQCGLAPGYITIAANHLAKPMSEIHELRCRVGALPRNPTNQLKYNLTWSTNGLVNEYCNPCEALVDGKMTLLPPLENLEEFTLDGIEYEAFNTSGGLGSLGESLAGRARNVNYKTIRYPGHCAQMRLLMNDLKLNEDRATLKRILENAVPQTLQDVVIVYVAVAGRQHGELREENYVSKIYPQVIDGRLWSAIQVTTAAGLAAVLDEVMQSAVPRRGLSGTVP